MALKIIRMASFLQIVKCKLGTEPLFSIGKSDNTG